MLKHELTQEFPQWDAKIHSLKSTSTHFKKLYDEYTEIDHHIARIEQGIEATTDDHMHDLKARRVHLKDLILSELEAN